MKFGPPALLSSSITRRTASLTSLAVLLSACGGGGSDSQPPALPTIQSHPSDTSAPEGHTAVFSATVHSETPLTYQWLRNGAPIAGATDNVLSLSSVALADSGASFSLVATNAGGSVQSNAAKLSVEAAWVEGVAVATGALANLAQAERCIGLSNSGDLWIWNTSNRELSRKNQQGAMVPLRGTIERLELARDVPGNPGFKDTPYDVSILEHSDGNLYVAEVYSGGNGIINTVWGMGGRVHRVAQNGEKTLIYNSENAPTRITPHAIAEGLNGNIFILNFNSGAIFEISTTGVLKKFVDTLTPPDQDIPAILDYRNSYRSMAICAGEIFVSFSGIPIAVHDYRITPARVIEPISFGSRGVLGLASHGAQLYLLTRGSFSFSYLKRRNADGSLQDIAGGFGGELRLLGVAPDGRVLLGEIAPPGSEFKYGKYLIITPPKQ